MTSQVISLNGSKGAWVYTNDKFTSIYPVDVGSKAGQTLTDFTNDVGILPDLCADLAAELTGWHTEFQKEVRHLKTKMTFSEAERNNQIHKVDLEMRKLKHKWHRMMVQKRVPKYAWDYVL
eukprot:1966710-Ditylum_brightwellii.AAC.1